MRFLFLLTTTFLILSCGSETGKKTVNFDYGKVKQGVYSNNYFNFSIPYDTTWNVQEQDAMSKLVREKSDVMFDEEQLSPEQLEASMINTAYLFTLFKHEVGAAVDFNPSLIVLAENLKNYAKITTAKEYIQNSKELLLNSKIDYSFGNDSIDVVKIGSKNFHRLKAYINTPDINISQHYFCHVTKGFSLAFIISFSSPEGQKELENILGDVKF